MFLLSFVLFVYERQTLLTITQRAISLTCARELKYGIGNLLANLKVKSPFIMPHYFVVTLLVDLCPK
jgi:hypothetical protein